MKVNYNAFLEDGYEFDSSRRRDKPFEFLVGDKDILACWNEAITQT